MENASIYETMSAKRNVKLGQKAWKYIYDLNILDPGDLNKTAIIDGTREYTYGSMFHEWENYASVFSALGMTDAQKVRVGILGTASAEVIFSFYGLNMVGAEVSLIAAYYAFNTDRIIDTIRQENLTDFILTDDIVQQDLLRELLIRRKELGLRHIILLHVPVSGPATIPLMTGAHEAKYASMKARFRPICMETLLKAFGSHPVRYSVEENNQLAGILHTTGTTSGTGKPIPLSDSALNAAVARFLKLKDLSLPYDNLVTAVITDLSNSYGLVDQIHLPFAIGATVVTAPGAILNPMYYKVIPAYQVSFMFSVNSMFERWMKMPENTDFDFSSLKFVALGGALVSAADKKRYLAFLEKHGAKDISILNGYGLTELGGACCLSSPDLDDESVGKPMPGIAIKLYDDETKTFFSPKGKASEGVLYLSTTSMATLELDGKETVKTEIIDHKPYICTNDQVLVDEDGQIIYLGRANRFFMSQEGRKYESGRVETEFSRLEDIESCAIVPAYVKMHHDNIPMLCVKPVDGTGTPEDVILKAFRQVFITEKILPEEDLPLRVMLVETFPLNINGKIDLFKLNRGQISGKVYDVEEVRESEQLTDFKLNPCEEGPSDVVDQIFDDIKEGIKNKLPANTMQNIMGQSFPMFNQNAVPFMPPKMPNPPFMLNNVARAVLPVLHQQTVQRFSNMNQMNQMAFEMFRRFNEQRCELNDKWFELLKKMVSPEMAAANGRSQGESSD